MRRVTATVYRRTRGLALVAAAGAVALAGCDGSASPSVASIPSTNSNPTASQGGSSGASAAALASGDPSRTLDAWAACMRSHGDPNQADPSVDANKVIHILWNPAVPGGYMGLTKAPLRNSGTQQGNLGPGQYCRNYLRAAQSALRGGRSPQRINPPSHAQLVKHAECMRANGVPDFPDPTGSGLQLTIGGDLNPQEPGLRKAATICATKTGYHFPVPGGTTPPPGTIRLVGAGPGP